MLTAAVAAALLTLAIGAAVAWKNSDAVLVPSHPNWPQEIAVEVVLPGQIVLERTEGTERPGVSGLTWQGGHAVVGRVQEMSEDTVTRALLELNGYLVPGMDVALDSYTYAGNPRQATGLPYGDVEIEGELGPMPAWLIPAPGESVWSARDGDSWGTWAIFVHGINSNPQSGLRIAPVLRRAGMPTLLITYREDPDAPESPDGYHHMGLTEWHDLEAAAEYAVERGASNLVVVGYSMGGAIVTQFMQKSPLAGRVDALILDAPVLDWKRTIEFNATRMGFPGIAAIPVEWAIGARIDADWDSLDALQPTDDLRLPILLFHGEDDDVVPIETSDEFAAELADSVTYHRVPEAGHTESWNVDPALYRRRVAEFLDAAPIRDRPRKRNEPDRSRARVAE